MDNRRLLIAVVLSMAVVALWSFLFPPPEPPETLEPSEQERPVAEETFELDGDQNGRAGSGPSMPDSRPGEGPAASGQPLDVESLDVESPDAESLDADSGGAAALDLPEDRRGEVEERVVLESAEARFELTNRGAQLISVTLKEVEDADGAPLQMVRRRAGGPYPYALVSPDGGELPVNRALFAVERSEDRRSVRFAYRQGSSWAEKHFSIDDQGMLAAEVSAGGDWELFFGPGVRDIPESERGRFAREEGVYLQDGDVERPEAKKADEDVPICGLPAAPAATCGGLAWVGLEGNYFLAAVLPEGGLAAARLRPLLVDHGPLAAADELAVGGETVEGGGELPPPQFVPLPPELSKREKELKRDFALLLSPAGEELTTRAFYGTKRYDALSALPRGLERSVNLGFFDWLARPLMWGLQWIHDNVVANYGWAIVLMTILIKLLLLPLTHHSTVSMRKMQKLNPKMQEIRQRWAGKLKDKKGRPNMEAQRKMNEEIMGLYKSEGVNPAGGCLPMLLQLPVFFAFYQMLYGWVELRHAPWIGWIEDLSAPDPYYALPIIMGATQFLQQKMMPATGNPMQRRIMMFMPVFFTFIFLGFPSGLVLYWLTNNVLSVGQQWVYNRVLESNEEPEGRTDKGGKSKKGKGRPNKRAAK